MFQHLKSSWAELWDRTKCGGKAGGIALLVCTLLAGAIALVGATFLVVVHVWPLNQGAFWLGAVALLLVRYPGLWLASKAVRFTRYARSGALQRFWGFRQLRQAHYKAAARLKFSRKFIDEPCKQESWLVKVRNFCIGIEEAFSDIVQGIACALPRKVTLNFGLKLACHMFSLVAGAAALTYLGFSGMRAESPSFTDHLMILISFNGIVSICMVAVWLMLDDRSIPTPEERLSAVLALGHIPAWSGIGAVYMGQTWGIYAFGLPVLGILVAAAILGFFYRCDEEEPEIWPGIHAM